MKYLFTTQFAGKAFVIWNIQTIWTIASANTRHKQFWQKEQQMTSMLPRIHVEGWVISEIVLWTARRDIVACLPFHNQKNSPLSSLHFENPFETQIYGDNSGNWTFINISEKQKAATTESLKQQPSEIDVKSPSRVLFRTLQFFILFENKFSSVMVLPLSFFIFVWKCLLHSSRLMVERRENEGEKGIFLENLERALKLLW